MSLTAAVLARPVGRMIMLAKGLVTDISADRFARFPIADGKPVTINHPAFALGHLVLYPSRIAGVCGLDANTVAPPEGFEDLFAPGVECRDDADGTVYPNKDTMIAAFVDSHERVAELIAGLRDEDLDRELENERYRDAFGTSGGATAFLLGGHAGFHLGQISAWRRAMGMPSAF
ncbi:MAG: DinB family protein [Planctomycetota bacterium]